MSDEEAGNKEVLENIRDVLAGKEEDGSEAKADDEILDLTQKVNEDGSITDITAQEATEEPAQEAEPKAEVAPQETAPEEAELDVLGEIDEALADPAGEVELELSEETPKEEPTTNDEPQAEEEKMTEETPKEEPSIDDIMGDAVTAAPAEAAPVEAAPAAAEPAATDGDAILSEAAAGAAKSSLQNLVDQITPEDRGPDTEPSAPFRSGETVEDLVTEMLKPMMKEWLDSNLPKLVEDVVEREIKKIIPR